jgi:hypothetical protein
VEANLSMRPPPTLGRRGPRPPHLERQHEVARIVRVVGVGHNEPDLGILDREFRQSQFLKGEAPLRIASRFISIGLAGVLNRGAS